MDLINFVLVVRQPVVRSSIRQHLQAHVIGHYWPKFGGRRALKFPLKHPSLFYCFLNRLDQTWNKISFCQTFFPPIPNSNPGLICQGDAIATLNTKIPKKVEMFRWYQSYISILRPFLLRRIKRDVEQNLPKKKEIILYLNMTDYQKNIQNRFLSRTLESYFINEYSTYGMPPTRQMKGKLNSLFIQLRKNCNHPDLIESQYDGSYFYPPVNQLIEQCGKLQLLDRLVNSLLSRKHKCLVFSQWTKVLDILDHFFAEKGLEACRLDCGVKLAERKRQIDEFNDLNSTVSVFLISPRAGGLGINLTAADTCIIYNSDWNPQMDICKPWIDVYRIGQTHPVHVYRLATSHTVEGRIIKRALGKLKLEHVVITEGQFQQRQVEEFLR